MLTTDKVFKLEYSEEQEFFHYNEGNEKPETNSYFTVIEYCSRKEKDFFMSYIEAQKVKKYTKEFLLESADKCGKILTNLMNRQLVLTNV